VGHGRVVGVAAVSVRTCMILQTFLQVEAEAVAGGASMRLAAPEGEMTSALAWRGVQRFVAH